MMGENACVSEVLLYEGPEPRVKVYLTGVDPQSCLPVDELCMCTMHLWPWPIARPIAWPIARKALKRALDAEILK